MNLKEKRAAKAAELAELKERVEAGEDEAIEAAEAIVGEIGEIDAQIEKAEKARGLLDAMKAAAPQEPNAQKRARTIGEHVAMAVKASGLLPGMKGRVSATEFKAATDVQKVPAALQPAITDIDRTPVLPYQRPTVLDLFSSETIAGNALTYFVYDGAVEGGFATVAENAKKPQIHFADPRPVTESLTKIAAYMKESDEVLADTAWLASILNNRLLYLHELERENQVLNGAGTGTNLTGLLNRNGIQAGTYVGADSIMDAMTKVTNQTGFAPDAVVINPADYQTLRLAKDSNLQYYGGGYFYGQYGTNGVVEQPPIWGLRTVVTPAVAAGTVVVGAFKQGASIVEKGGVSVELYNQNEDDAIHNRVTIVCESRLALAVRYPAAFVKLTAE